MIALSGFTSFAYEVMWTRLLSHMVGVSVVAFATMLASFLAGIALGSAIAARFASNRRTAALGFAVAQLGIAALSLAAFAICDRLPDLRDGLRARGISNFSVWSDVSLCALTLLPPALFIGATFPFAVRVLARGGEDTGPLARASTPRTRWARSREPWERARYRRDFYVTLLLGTLRESSLTTYAAMLFSPEVGHPS